MALKLAEARICCEVRGEEPIILLDDVLSELDARRQEFVLNRITAGQVFITCCEEGALSRLRDGGVFHIRNGALL